jgi:hypothetical protein
VEEVEEDVTRQDPEEALLLLLDFGERNEHWRGEDAGET